MTKGFLVEQVNADGVHYLVKELKDELRTFILVKLREASCPCSFDKIHQWVNQKNGGFFTKEFIFRAIDLLF